MFIVDHLAKQDTLTTVQCKDELRNILRCAFGFTTMDNIDLVYPKQPIVEESDLLNRCENWFKTKVRDNKGDNQEHLIETLFENANKSMMATDKAAPSSEDVDEDDDSDDETLEESTWKISNGFDNPKTYKNVESTIVDILCDKSFEREGKINEIIRSLRNHFPALEGDKVTFIGSTFMRYGESEPYLNHCIVLNSCDKLLAENTVIETYDTEQEVLLAWAKLVREENPDIILGYNISCFDYEFMFRRSQELHVV